ncbi:hypothetical protein BLA29_003253 [Euroglyphus maynei]|uniref:Uncharacterized protein n=1 Tax=Euroglyphus maynei TaxID=6958 RepID=A0A1Y3BHA2_EURMA|nr:hypothetical protein BLA29_003253 [Euroglyphus maynei]
MLTSSSSLIILAVVFTLIDPKITCDNNILLECLQFSPSTIHYCGHSLPMMNGWIVHKTDDLIDVMSHDPDNLIDYVLFLEENSAKFLLNYPHYSHNDESIDITDVFCLHFDYIFSDHCEQGYQCLINATFTDQRFDIDPNITIEYNDSSNNGWRQMYMEFNIAHQWFLISIMNKPLLTINGQIHRKPMENLGLNMGAYIALKMIKVSNGKCPRRIDPRSE